MLKNGEIICKELVVVANKVQDVKSRILVSNMRPQLLWTERAQEVLAPRLIPIGSLATKQ